MWLLEICDLERQRGIPPFCPSGWAALYCLKTCEAGDHICTFGGARQVSGLPAPVFLLPPESPPPSLLGPKVTRLLPPLLLHTLAGSP